MEIFHIIEHFCLGRRRLHLFGRDSTIRPGWLTVGPELTSSNFDAEVYASFFSPSPEACVTGCTDEIERLRPKSPTPKNKQAPQQNDRGGRGGRVRGGQTGPNMRGGLRTGGMSRGTPPGRGAPSGRFRGSGRGGAFRVMRDDMR